MVAQAVSAVVGPNHDQVAVVCIGFLIFATADAFSLPFMSLMSADLLGAGTRQPGLLTGLPITLFWLSVAVAQVTTRHWERGRDRRQLFLVGTGLGALGLGLAAMASHFVLLCGARTVSGFGYGMVLILTQDYLLRAFGAKSRTLASGLYIGLFFGGYLLGSPVGSYLAQHFGYTGTMAAAAALSAGSCLLTFRLRRGRQPVPPHNLSLRALAGNRRVVLLIFLGAIPMRLINGGVVYLLAPLYLAQQGAQTTDIGQVIMIFAVVLAATSVPWSRLIDRTDRPFSFTLLGMVVSGLAMFVIPAGMHGIAGTAITMAVLGTGQALGMSPQVTVLFRIARDEVANFGQTGVIGLYRVSERIGLMVGPLLAGGMLRWFGAETAHLILGGMILACASLLGWGFIIAGKLEALGRPGGDLSG